MKYRYDSPIALKRSKKYGNNYVQFYSPKIDRVVTANSNLEYFNLITLEMDPFVEWYCEQPVEAHLFDPLGKEEICIPDVYVYYRDGKEEMQEVKYSAEYEGEGPETSRAWAQRRREERWSRENGMEFVVRTENEIIVGKNVQNLRYLCRRIRPKRIPQDKLRTDIKNYVDSHVYKGNKLKDLKDMFDIPYSSILDCIAFMYWKGEVDIPDVFSDTVINLNSRITLPGV